MCIWKFATNHEKPIPNFLVSFIRHISTKLASLFLFIFFLDISSRTSYNLHSTKQPVMPVSQQNHYTNVPSINLKKLVHFYGKLYIYIYIYNILTL